MKKILLFLAISLSIFATQSCNDDKKDEKKEDKTISASDVPASVQTAFTAKYATATDVKWEDAHENEKETYKVKFIVDGKKMKAEFDTNGGFVKESEDN